MESVHDGSKFSDLIAELQRSLGGKPVTLRMLLEKLGRRGYLVLSLLLAVPFLLPVTIPGSSIPFGLVIASLGLGMLFCRSVWLPDRLLGFSVSPERFSVWLTRAAALVTRAEKWIHPRLEFMTSQNLQPLNGALISLGGLLLMCPFPLPFTNTLPGIAVVCLSAGMIERDGAAVLTGYLFLILATFYISLIVTGGIAGAKALAGIA